MVGVVALAALGLLPISVAAVLGVGVMLVTGCMSWKEAVRGLSTPVVMIIVTSLALGKALDRDRRGGLCRGRLRRGHRPVSPPWSCSAA